MSPRPIHAVLAAIGLPSLTAFLYRDAILFPVLALFLILTVIALRRARKSP